jgi:xanthine/uracil permease
VAALVDMMVKMDHILVAHQALLQILLHQDLRQLMLQVAVVVVGTILVAQALAVVMVVDKARVVALPWQQVQEIMLVEVQEQITTQVQVVVVQVLLVHHQLVGLAVLVV